MMPEDDSPCEADVEIIKSLQLDVVPSLEFFAECLNVPKETFRRFP